MAIRRSVYWISGIALCLCLAFATWVALFTDLGVLLVCAGNSSRPTLQWFCKNSIYAFRLTPDEVWDLNQDAGAYAAVTMRDKAEAEKMLKFFLSRGVDINSLSGLSSSTALHLAVSSNDLKEVELLLVHGAKTDVKDAQNQTPFERAKSLQKRYPQEDYSQILKLLDG